MIDPGEFPLMIDVWENMFGIEIEEEPQIGLVDISEVLIIHQKLTKLRLAVIIYKQFAARRHLA